MGVAGGWRVPVWRVALARGLVTAKAFGWLLRLEAVLAFFYGFGGFGLKRAKSGELKKGQILNSIKIFYSFG